MQVEDPIQKPQISSLLLADHKVVVGTPSNSEFRGPPLAPVCSSLASTPATDCAQTDLYQVSEWNLKSQVVKWVNDMYTWHQVIPIYGFPGKIPNTRPRTQIDNQQEPKLITNTNRQVVICHFVLTYQISKSHTKSQSPIPNHTKSPSSKSQ